MKSLCLITCLSIGSVLSIFSQNIIDLEIDSIHYQDGFYLFLNISENEMYDCEIVSHKLGTDRYSYALDCSSVGPNGTSRMKENILDLQKIENLNDFLNWAEKRQFYTEYEVKDQPHSALVQPVNKRYFSITQRNELDEEITWQTESDKTYELIPIRVNNQYFIGGLIELGYYDIDFMLFPTKDGKGKFVNNNNIFIPTNKTVELKTDYLKDIFRFYRVRKVKNKYILTNSISRSPLLDDLYDEIKLIYPFVVASKDNQVSIYNTLLTKLDLPEIIAAYDNIGAVQIITNNTVKWLTLEGEISDKLIPVRSFARCGNVPCLQKSIYDSGGQLFEIVKDCSISGQMNNTSPDTFEFNLNTELVDIKYLSESTNQFFSENCYNRYFCHADNLYYFKTKKGEQGIFRRTDEKAEKLQAVFNDENIPINERQPTYQKLRTSLKRSFRDEIIFQGKFEEFKLLGYDRPIVFKQKGLYGIYPQMKEAKYVSFGQFVGNLAEIKLPNGDEGWIDLNGKEILKQSNLKSR